MDQHPRNPYQSKDSKIVPAIEAAGLASIPVSEHLRNLANQTVIQSQRLDIVQEIRENPGKDAPRIKYAEHLESYPLTTRDTARAELIRLQIARKEDAPTAREREILLKHEREWMRELGHVRGIEWDRGFITGVTMSPRHFAQSQAPLSREPITHLRIHVPGGSEEGGTDLQAAVQAPHFVTIEKLSFWIASTSALEHIQNLLGSPEAKLREIHFQLFAGSHEELLATCHRLHYPSSPQSSLDLALGDISITFGSMR
jgi:hypothetical protein